MAFTYIDLFAGIGGFHAALSAMGGQCVYASEIDKEAARIYAQNWGLAPDGDITLAANDEVMNVPPHDVLVGGFPCQPFSKSGKQLGMEETRGTLFWNIAKIIEAHKPTLVLLENVRNIAGPRHIHEWEVIIQTLRNLGYRVSSQPLVLSPHKIPPEFGGRPQVRERVFISATLIPDGFSDAEEVLPPDLEKYFEGFMNREWDLRKDLPIDTKLTKEEKTEVLLNETEIRWISAWNDFVVTMKSELNGGNLPGFPIWADCWMSIEDMKLSDSLPEWKRNFLIKNAEFYSKHKNALDAWLKRWDNLSDFPPSRKKLEWQAQDAKDLWSTVMHFRPSGIRAKRPTYVPALVAITQTSILGSAKRRITIREGARLQGLPDWFSFEGQRNAQSYKQLGNGVNVAAVYNVIKAQVVRDEDLLEKTSPLLMAIQASPKNPDQILQSITKASEVQTELNFRKASKSIQID